MELGIESNMESTAQVTIQKQVAPLGPVQPTPANSGKKLEGKGKEQSFCNYFNKPNALKKVSRSCMESPPTKPCGNPNNIQFQGE